MIYTPHPAIDPLVQQNRSLLFDPSYLDTLGASASEAFRLSAPLALFDWLEMGPKPEIPEETLRRMGMTDSEIGQYQKQKSAETFLSKEDYATSPHFREGKEWFEGMTDEQAEMLAERADQQARNQFILSHGKTAGHTIAAIAGALIGSIPDPTNFIPVLGPVLRAASIAKFGRVAGTALVTGAEAGIVTAAIQPLFFAHADSFQEQWDMAMAAEMVALSMGVGSGFGALVGGFSRVSGVRRSRATAKAARDMMDNQPVDVAPVMGDRVDFDAAARVALGAEDALPRNVGDFLARFAPDVAPQESAQAVLKILAKPGFQRSAEEKALIGGLDITPEIREAARISEIPAFQRSAEDKVFLDHFKAGKFGELENPRWTQRQKERLEERAMDFTVAEREHVPPDVEPTTEKNVNTVHEPDTEISEGLDARIRELDEAGALPEEGRRELAEAEEFTVRTDKWAEGWRDAAACLSKATI
ncbi:MAG: hypothetical protein V3W44_08570 [Dehalococcoidales bacterium]